MWYLNEEDDEQFEVYADVIDSTIYLSEQKNVVRHRFILVAPSKWCKLL
ncbi:hypothetical protein QW180_15455 [Vibrio sinaloensis]|nr:hypothetical protein [Vibrio sinaloensis]